MTALTLTPKRLALRQRKAAARGGQSEANTFKLPTGEAIRRELVKVFREQRRQILASLESLKSFKADQDIPTGGGGADPIEWRPPPFRLGTLAMSERMTPLLEAIWEPAGQRFYATHDLDPDEWRVVNPHLQGKIRGAAFAFCESTNRTTSDDLNSALDRLRGELIEGRVERGEGLRELTKRVNGVFDQAETWRARRIAASEASRAHHAAREEAAIQSGIVAGWEWLLSSDACPLCQTVGRRAKFVKLGQPFATVGDHPVYSEVRHPPLHPGCQCTTIEVLTPEYGGPAPPGWSPTLEQPEPEPQDHPPPIFGPSKAKVVASNEEETRATVQNVLGKRAKLVDVASAVGAPDDATVKVEAIDEDALMVEVESEAYEAGRLIRRQGDDAVIDNDWSRLAPDQRGKGLGAAILGRQVEQAARLGVARINAKASRGPDWNGYYTWPRLGFDAPIPSRLRGQLPATLESARSLSDLMATPEGRAWWRTEGETVYASFDLQPGSTSRQLLDAYLAETQARGKSFGLDHKAASARVEEPDLAPGDDAILDRVCDRVLGGKG